MFLERNDVHSQVEERFLLRSNVVQNTVSGQVSFAQYYSHLSEKEHKLVSCAILFHFVSQVSQFLL